MALDVFQRPSCCIHLLLQLQHEIVVSRSILLESGSRKLKLQHRAASPGAQTDMSSWNMV